MNAAIFSSMKLRRLFIVALWANLLTAGATAETTVIRPDLCPFAVDAPRILDLGDVEAADLNPARRAADSVVVIYAPPADGWARRRLFARFILDPETGEAYGAPPPAACSGLR